MKKLLAAAGKIPFVRRAFHPFLRNHASIFMLHRFAHPESGVSGHDPERLRRALEYLRREKVRILSLADLLHEGRTGGDISGAVAFTVDDGYFDIHAVAAPIFERYDCPVTVFLTTGFLDGHGWLWWDRIRFMLRETQVESVELKIGGAVSRLQWGEADDRRRVAYQVTNLLAEVTALERIEAVDRLQHLLGMHVPDGPTPAYSPLTWDQVRDLGRRGFTFGPHTLTHPNLAELAEAEAVAEIEGSWSRIKEETDAAVPIFCFPYGRPWSLTKEVLSLPKAIGLEGAVTAEERYSSARDYQWTPFALPRFGWPDTLAEVRHITAGMSRAKDVLLGQG